MAQFEVGYKFYNIITSWILVLVGGFKPAGSIRPRLGLKRGIRMKTSNENQAPSGCLQLKSFVQIY